LGRYQHRKKGEKRALLRLNVGPWKGCKSEKGAEVVEIPNPGGGKKEGGVINHHKN